jgi:hypothetical protein
LRKVEAPARKAAAALVAAVEEAAAVARQLHLSQATS